MIDAAKIRATVGLPPTKEYALFSWGKTLLTCLYFAVCYGGFLKTIPIFQTLFSGLGVDLPMPTRALLASYVWLLPALLVAACVVAVAKQFTLFGNLLGRVANWFLICVWVFPAIIVALLYLPLFVLILRLHGS